MMAPTGISLTRSLLGDTQSLRDTRERPLTPDTQTGRVHSAVQLHFETNWKNLFLPQTAFLFKNKYLFIENSANSLRH